MSLYDAKCRAIRQTLISEENSEKLTKYLQEQGIENMPYSKLAEHFITNGDCGLDVDLETPLREAFVKFADEHSLWCNPNIVKRVNESTNDFLMENWSDIWDEILNCDYIENVMYVVTEEMDGDKWERDKCFDICSTWEKAVESFNESKENAIDSMNDRCDEDDIEVEADNETHYMIEANYYEYWYEVMIEKKEVR